MGVGALSALLMVAGALVLLRFGVQWLGLGTAPTSRAALRVTSTCALGPRRRLHIVEAHGRHILVSASEQGISLLQELPPPDAAADAPAGTPRSEATPAVAEPPGAPHGRLARLRPLRHLLLTLLPLGALLWLLLPVPAAAQAAGPSLTLSMDGGATAPEGLSSTLEALALLTVVAVAPSILLMATCFTRIVIVLALMRQALGVQHLPPNQVLVGLSLFTTFFVMAPVADSVRLEAYEPYTRQEIGGEEAVARAVAPFRTYMLEFTHESDLDLFLSLAEIDEELAIEEVPLTSLLPAFVLSELRAAFEIGFMVYLPFLVIDLVIASMLISMGMIVLPPVVISLPFKLMLFVLLDGWSLVVGSLVTGLRG